MHGRKGGGEEGELSRRGSHCCRLTSSMLQGGSPSTIKSRRCCRQTDHASIGTSTGVVDPHEEQRDRSDSSRAERMGAVCIYRRPGVVLEDAPVSLARQAEPALHTTRISRRSTSPPWSHRCAGSRQSSVMQRALGDRWVWWCWGAMCMAAESSRGCVPEMLPWASERRFCPATAGLKEGHAMRLRRDCSRMTVALQKDSRCPLDALPIASHVQMLTPIPPWLWVGLDPVSPLLLPSRRPFHLHLQCCYPCLDMCISAA